MNPNREYAKRVPEQEQLPLAPAAPKPKAKAKPRARPKPDFRPNVVGVSWPAPVSVSNLTERQGQDLGEDLRSGNV